MTDQRIDELVAEIIGYAEPAEGQLALAKAAVIDPTTAINFITALIAAIQACRDARARALARRVRRGRPRVAALLAGQIQLQLLTEGSAAETTTVRQLRVMSRELAERTVVKAQAMDRDELVDAVEELQDRGEW